MIKKIADAEMQATEMHTALIAKYAEIREELADLLSENGLGFVVEEFVKNQAGDGAQQEALPPRPSAPPPHTPVD